MLIIPTKNYDKPKVSHMTPKFVLKLKIRTNLPNESLCTQIKKMLGARVILQKRVAPLKTFIIPLI